MHFFLFFLLQQSSSLRLRDHYELSSGNSDESVRPHGYDAYDFYGYDQYGYYGQECENDSWCGGGLVCIKKQCVHKPAPALDEINHSIRSRLYEPQSDAEEKKMEEEDKKLIECIEKHEEHEKEKQSEEDEEKDWYKILSAGMRRRLEFEKEEWVLHTGDDIHLLLSTHPFFKSQVEKWRKVKNLRHYLQCNKKMSEDSNNWILTRWIFGGDIRAKHFQDKKGELFMKLIWGESDEDNEDVKKFHKAFHKAVDSAYETYKSIEPLIHNPSLEEMKNLVENSIHHIANEFKDPAQMEYAIGKWAHEFGNELLEEDLVGSLSFVTRFTAQRIIKNTIKNTIKEKLPKESKLIDFGVDVFCDGFLKSIVKQVGGEAVHHVLGHFATHAAGHAAAHGAAHGLLWTVTHAATHGVVGAVFGATVTTALVHTALVSVPLIALRYFIKYEVGVYCESVTNAHQQDNLAKKLLCKVSNTEDLTEKDRRALIELNALNRASYVEIWRKSGYADNNDFENFIHSDPEVVQAWNSEFDKTAYHDGAYYFSTGHFMANNPFIALHDELYASQDPETERKWKKELEDYKAQQAILIEKRFLALDAYNYVDHDYNFDIDEKKREADQIREEEREAQFGKNPEIPELDHPGWDQGYGWDDWC